MKVFHSPKRLRIYLSDVEISYLWLYSASFGCPVKVQKGCAAVTRYINTSADNLLYIGSFQKLIFLFPGDSVFCKMPEIRCHSIYSLSIKAK